MHWLSWLYGTAGFCLFVLGHRLILSAAVHALAPAALPGRGRAVFAGAYASFVSQSGLPGREIALAHHASGCLSPRQSACLALCGVVILPVAVLVPPAAACAMLLICLVLTAAGGGNAGLWGRAVLGLALFSLGRTVTGLGEPYAFVEAGMRAVLDALFSPLPGFVIGMCLSFLFRSAGAVGAFIVCSSVPMTAAQAAVLFTGCVFGEALCPLYREGSGREKRFALFLALVSVFSYGIVTAAAAVFAPGIPLDGVILRTAAYAALSLSGSLLGAAIAALLLKPRRAGERGAPPRLKYWHPRLAEMPPAALKVLYREACLTARGVRGQLAGAVDALSRGDPDARPAFGDGAELPGADAEELLNGLAAVTAREMTDREAALAGIMYRVVNDLKHMAEHARHLKETAERGEAAGIGFGRRRRRELAQAGERVLGMTDGVLSALEGWRTDRRDISADGDEALSELTGGIRARAAEKARRGKADPREAALLSECLTDLERIAAYAADITGCVGEMDGAGRH